MQRMASPSDLKEKGLAYWRVNILFSILFGGILMALAVFVPAAVMPVSYTHLRAHET